MSYNRRNKRLQCYNWWKRFFNQAVKNNLRTYDNIRKFSAVQGDDHTTGCLVDYPYFKEYYNLIATDLSKQEKLEVDSKAIQQINLLR